MPGPLRRPKEESFAQQRALLVPALPAARAAGYDQINRGNAARLDRSPRIRARIAELSAQDTELIRLKRLNIERELALVAFANVADLWEINDQGRLQLKDLASIPEELQRAIAEIAVEPEKIKTKMHSKLDALRQLRELLGVDQPPKAPVDQEGNPVIDNSRMIQVNFVPAKERESA